VWSGSKLLSAKAVKRLDHKTLDALLRSQNITHAIISSVAADATHMADYIAQRTQRCILLDRNTPLPIAIKYGTPATLGCDRIATAVGATVVAPGKAALVVDAGTAITLDVIDSDGTFCGGNISAGITLRLKALHQGTKRLPLVTTQGDVPQWGNDTITALRCGAVLGAVGEIERARLTAQQQLGKNVKLILTGGDSQLIAQHLQVEHIINEQLLATGLNRILLYNEKLS
ncbi:MAG: type III pantothenate kinase, partial [Muribaculaceae bacterium]|nr:type III pantothenate kinase [Muribaculaceae bacterium]